MAINSRTNSEDTSLHLGLQRMKKLRGKRAAVRKIALKTRVFCGGLKAKVLCVPKISDKPGPESPKFVKPNFPGWEELVQPPSGAGRGHPEEGHPPGGSRPRAKALRQHPRIVPVLIPTAPGGSSPAPGTPGTASVPGDLAARRDLRQRGDLGLHLPLLGSCAGPGSAGSSAEPPPPSRSRDHRQLPGTGTPSARPRAAPGAELPTPGICRSSQCRNPRQFPETAPPFRSRDPRQLPGTLSSSPLAGSPV